MTKSDSRQLGALSAMFLVQRSLFIGTFIGAATTAGAFLSSPPLTFATRLQLPNAWSASGSLATGPSDSCLRRSFTPLASSRDDEDDTDDDDFDEDDIDDDDAGEPLSVFIDTTMTDDKLKSLFAWIKCAFDADENDAYAYYYNNIELAIASVFGTNLPEDSLPAKLLREAMKGENLKQVEGSGLVSPDGWDEKLVGQPISRADRESASLGAMGAAQWSGQWMTRPHSLLRVTDFGDVDEWVKTLPRGCKRTLKKATAEAQNFTVVTKDIRGGDPAPHSSYAHFRCVVEHEVRLLSNMYGSSTNAFMNALAEAISRYMGTTRMAGSIREYRDVETNKILGFAHEVGKGRTTRGQWFYIDDDAATRYVWFHSVADLVRRAVKDDRVDVVDLGPSGSDSFSELKARYGFESVVDWPAKADYSGDFHYEDGQNNKEAGEDVLRMIEELMRNQAK